MKSYSYIPDTAKAVAKASLFLSNATDEFKLSFGNTGLGNFATGITFSGQSGYFFTPSGDFVGGYKSNVELPIQIDFHSGGRTSLSIKEKLITNNLLNTGSYINAVEFDKPSGSIVNIVWFYEPLN